MSLLEHIQELCRKIEAYSFVFENKAMFNACADNISFPCIFFEEYREGSYRTQYYFEKITRIQLSFCKLCAMHAKAAEREALRESIENEAVKPFISLFNANKHIFDKVSEWKFYTPAPRFDVNEVSIMLQFDLKSIQCHSIADS
jgi:hypothetical protein